jgi:hypothetical protein
VLFSWRVPKLTHLHIADNYHTGQGLVSLLRAEWPELRELQLYGRLVARWERDFLEELLRRRWRQCEVFL